MKREVFEVFVQGQVDDAIKEGFSAFGTDEAIAETLYQELPTAWEQLPESIREILLGLLVTLELRNRQLRTQSIAH